MPQDWAGFVNQLSSMFSPSPTPEAQYDARMANGMQAGAKAAGIAAPPEASGLRQVLNALTGYPLPGEPATGMDVAMAAAPLLPLGKVIEALGAGKAVGLIKGAPNAEGFYSRVDDAAARLIPVKGAHPNKVASLLQSNASPEELAYRKVPEFLASRGNTAVTQADLQAHLAQHPPPMPNVKTLQAHRDTVTDWLERNGEGVPSVPEEWTRLSAQLERTAQGWQRAGDTETANRFFGFAEDAGRHAEGVSTITGSTAGQPKYAKYQLPGGENYRETLLSLPASKEPANQELQSAFTQANEQLNAFRRAYPDAELEGLANPEYRRLVLARNRIGEQLTAAENAHVASQFRSSHFPDTPNIVAHTRANDRTLPTGERGRFVEEVQSDWHQKGKKEGYQSAEQPQAVDTSRWHAAQTDTGWRVTDVDGNVLGRVLRGTPGGGGAGTAQEAIAHVARNTEVAARYPSKVPDAPFKDSWPDLGLKQQILDAARDPQASWIGHTGGATQAARYDLSKQIGQVRYDPQTHYLEAFDHGGDRVIQQEGVRPEQLPDYIGKEAAEKLVAQPLLNHAADQTAYHTLSGVDLQVGGEGMKHFYDQLLPKRLEKIVKPFGGTVERGTIPTSSPTPDFGEQAWFARLTPEMKARILKEGLPLMALPVGLQLQSSHDAAPKP